jgi:phosphoribosylformylglycinamidine synthase PurS subunit
MAIAEIYVTLKPALLDVQGATVLKSLHQLGHSHAADVRIGKYITVAFDDAISSDDMQAHLDAMCRELLANPVIEDYRISLNGATTAAAAQAPVAVPSVVARDTVPVTATAPVVRAEATVPSAAVPAAAASTTIADPFGVAYTDYVGMSAEEQLELQGKAWQQHGPWIERELATRGATWILAVGPKVEESGETLDSYPSEAKIAALGASSDLVPWVFTRAPQD